MKQIKLTLKRKKEFQKKHGPDWRRKLSAQKLARELEDSPIFSQKTSYSLDFCNPDSSGIASRGRPF